MTRVLLKDVLIIIITGSLTALGTPAAAYVAEILTSIQAADGEGDQLEDAVNPLSTTCSNTPSLSCRPWSRCETYASWEIGSISCC